MKRLFFEYIPAWLLLAVLGFIVLHAPITVFVSTHWPEATLYAKAWKELAILAATVLILIDYIVSKSWRTVRNDKLLWAAAAFGALHLLLVPLSQGSANTLVAGLMIDLRYIAYFAAVYMYVRRYPKYRTSFLKVGLIGACIVVGFAVLQLFLPHDFLKYLGYGHSTIEPYMTVDKNPDFIRQNSTLRGPNPLGAYAIMVLAGVVAFGVAVGRSVRSKRVQYGHLGLAIAGLVALWVSYSRGAWLGAVVALGLVLVAGLGSKITRRVWSYIVLVGLLVVVGLYLTKDTAFVQNIIVHNNPETGSAIDSNQGHIDSLQQGIERTIREPLGAGIGSTGSASMLGGSPVVIENQFLFVAHEAGWLGLIVWITLIMLVLWQLWRSRRDWMALAAFASGVGLLVVGLFLPVWVDDTVSLVWWGMTAAILAAEGVKHARTTNKKAKRTT